MPHYNGGEPIDTPACFLEAARELSGWALGKHKTERYPNGTLKVTIHLSHRGGFTVPHAPFRAHANGYHVQRVHSFVRGSWATVWLTVCPEF